MTQASAPAEPRKAIIPVFDQGHTHVGWTVLSVPQETVGRIKAGGVAALTLSDWLNDVTIVATGVFSAPTNSALASEARGFRRARRTKNQLKTRIRNLAALFINAGIISAIPAPKAATWKMAADALDGKIRLTGDELFNVLRWYAHNRGPYCSWGNGDGDMSDKDKLASANALLAKHGTSTFAHTVYAEVKAGKRFSLNHCAFDREKVIIPEVRRILLAHVGVLPGLTDTMVSVLLDGVTGPDEQAILTSAGISLPKNHELGVLMGQLRPRFDNRIIGRCPIDGKNVPSKANQGYLNFRWAMLMANVRVYEPAPRALSPEERFALNQRMQERGFFTPADFIQAVTEAAHLSSSEKSNARALSMLPDADENLVVDYAKRAIPSDRSRGANKVFATKVWPILTEKARQVSLNLLRKDREITPDFLRRFAEPQSELTTAIDAWSTALAKTNSTGISCATPAGRAPYSAGTMSRAVAEVMEGKHPMEQGGALYGSSDISHAMPLAEKTNNHLVRHRIFLLKRLLRNIVRTHADGDYSAVKAVILETSREMGEFSGKTIKEIDKELANRTSAHRKAITKLHEAGITNPSAKAIRKTRIAIDMGFRCPFTDYIYHNHLADFGQDHNPSDPYALEIEHIWPRADQQTDSLAATTLCPQEVNRVKGRRTAIEFVKDMGGQTLPQTGLQIKPYERFVAEMQAALESEKKALRTAKALGRHTGDIKVRLARLTRLLTERPTGGFTGQHSSSFNHITKLAGTELGKCFSHIPPDQRAQIFFIPGAVTGMIRRSWRLSDTLADVVGLPLIPCKDILAALSLKEGQDIPGHADATASLYEQAGKKRNLLEHVPRKVVDAIRTNLATFDEALARRLADLISKHSTPTKDEFRNRTELHHALDAIVLALAATLFPLHGRCHDLLQKRDLSPQEIDELKHNLPRWLVGAGRIFELNDLPLAIKQRISAALSSAKLVIHQPKSLAGAALLLNPVNPAEAIAQGERAGRLAGKWNLPGRTQTAKVVSRNWALAVRRDTSHRKRLLGVIPHEAVRRRLHELLRVNAVTFDEVEFWKCGSTITVPDGERPAKWIIQSIVDSKEGIKLQMFDPYSALPMDPHGKAYPYHTKLTVTGLLKRGAALSAQGIC